MYTYPGPLQVNIIIHGDPVSAISVLPLSFHFCQVIIIAIIAAAVVQEVGGVLLLYGLITEQRTVDVTERKSFIVK
jgi:hypothetical protein